MNCRGGILPSYGAVKKRKKDLRATRPSRRRYMELEIESITMPSRQSDAERPEVV